MKVQDNKIERVADKLIAAVASILVSQRAHRVEEKTVEGVGVGSGGHDVQVMAASVVEGDGTGSALGKPMSSAEAPSVQAMACNSSCGSAAGAVGETPDQLRLPVAADVRIREGCSAAPTVAAVKKRTIEKRRRRKTAARKAARVGITISPGPLRGNPGGR